LEDKVATMPERGAYGRRLGEHFGLEDAPVLISKTLRKAEIAVTQIYGNTSDPVATTPIPAEDAYLLGLQVRGCEAHELWFDQRALGARPFRGGQTLFYDLKRDPRSETRCPFHALMFYLPRSALSMLAEQADASAIEELRADPGVPYDDDQIQNLGFSLLAAFERPERVSRLFVDHVTMGIGFHVAHRYGGMRARVRPTQGGLAGWQERRVKDLLAADLTGETPLQEIAAACGVSVSHLSRAFRQSTGIAPHQWLLQRRVEHAKALLRDEKKSLADTALAS
jgi:hypothetical protein